MNEFEIRNQELVAYHGQAKKVIVPREVTSVADFAFYGCSGIETLIFADGLTHIGNLAFYQCTSLKEISLPDSIIAIGGNAFARCSSLEKIRLPRFLHTVSRSLFYYCTQLKHIDLPESLVRIEHDAFAFCTSLDNICFPPSVRQIDQEAFSGCTSLKNAELNEGLEKLGKKAFYHCPQLSALTLPQSLHTLEEACLQTGGPLKLRSQTTIPLIGRYFDEFYNYNTLDPRQHTYDLIESFIPYLDYKQFKPLARITLLINFLETYPEHPHFSRAVYEPHIMPNHDEMLRRLVKEKRFLALNQGLEAGLIQPGWLEPYFDQITDREEKAKLLSYRKQDSLASIEDDLMNLF